MLNCANMISSIFGYMTNPKLCIFVKPPKNLDKLSFNRFELSVWVSGNEKNKGRLPLTFETASFLYRDGIPLPGPDSHCNLLIPFPGCRPWKNYVSGQLESFTILAGPDL